MFVSWPSIGGFHNVVKTYEVYPHVAPGPVRYRGKIKLHGTNAAVTVRQDRVLAQSRTQIITSAEDNAGFARWVESDRIQEFFKARTVEGQDFTVFGEWCGPGIMSGTAINKIPNKIFAVFGLVIQDKNKPDDEWEMITCPITLQNWLHGSLDDIKILPWDDEDFTVEFSDRDNLKATASYLNEVIEKLEPLDPWVDAVFGIQGTAEGKVYYPYWNRETITVKQFSDLSFKAKGEKHKVLKMRENVSVDPEVAATIEEFVGMFVTPARLEQGVEQGASGLRDMRQMGPFLAWFVKDVEKESVDELEASGLEWKHVTKAVQLAARTWYVEQAKKL